jgi:hypothetical protein
MSLEEQLTWVAEEIAWREDRIRVLGEAGHVLDTDIADVAVLKAIKESLLALQRAV